MSFNFPLLLVVAVAVSGALALLDLLLLAPRRRAAIASYEGQVAAPDEQVLQRLNKEPLLVEYGKSFFPVLAIVLVLRSFLLEPFQIPSGSMKPTLEVGDFILVNKFAYGIRLPVIDTKIIDVGDPQRGDVMVFRYPSNPSINYIKRVVGLPGDRISYTTDKRLLVNGQSVAEQFLGEEPGSLGRTLVYQEKLGEAEHMIRKLLNRNIRGGDEWVVPQGHYFMMGDNRDDSNDSRYWNDDAIPKELWGMVPDQNIVGKAFAVWMSWPDPKSRNLPNFSRVGLIR
ncbi:MULTISPECIES: signal peptidase I [unclassified Pseudomonas]|uniref:signal peptidase I n=1 Tax=unclassified Pseudomonas TaxID=196821 RepID=UPI002447B9AF|nr:MULTISPECIES: signal peptidase I [unclassified Pseudomonas]MDG9928768.1 signal peptidase I [Pseudomonas sp. GD04042]MDH0481837.1 signal peptidase I [Pseudomonas sp. GD04015]MDH0603209.1 signal peptidase I [Pseudomonas sp. GD03869]MDH0894576.1 signal peptidase I [Pseudomonas sp. GD03875]MDH1063129.1 signal peptidase I [Pseudomonas sp. GD03985]